MTKRMCHKKCTATVTTPAIEQPAAPSHPNPSAPAAGADASLSVSAGKKHVIFRALHFSILLVKLVFCAESCQITVSRNLLAHTGYALLTSLCCKIKVFCTDCVHCSALSGVEAKASVQAGHAGASADINKSLSVSVGKGSRKLQGLLPVKAMVAKAMLGDKVVS